MCMNRPLPHAKPGIVSARFYNLGQVRGHSTGDRELQQSSRLRVQPHSFSILRCVSKRKLKVKWVTEFIRD